jgi:hypothetical protein
LTCKLPDGYKKVDVTAKFPDKERAFIPSFERFAEIFLDSLVVEGPGAVYRFYLTPVRGKETACDVHGYFFSKQVFREFKKMREVMDYIKTVYHVSTIWCTIPSEYVSLRRLLNQLGFGLIETIPGRYSRGGVLYDGLRFSY